MIDQRTPNLKSTLRRAKDSASYFLLWSRGMLMRVVFSTGWDRITGCRTDRLFGSSQTKRRRFLVNTTLTLASLSISTQYERHSPTFSPPQPRSLAGASVIDDVYGTLTYETMLKTKLHW
ncbi:uncharacterized protein ARMOST_14467 [Armillaria ostoyae]|uniref:Uncharacterized protein n=1 Tax=Armillaria ostoyae TaxID=47428 RepID=A0A284RQL2_ARMOS|nr:uncharacterized protein ARMOST_14467 [Armillaria ostoyae]